MAALFRRTIGGDASYYREQPGVDKEGTALMGADEVTRRILAQYEAGDLVTMCAWCRRVEIDGEWLLTPRAALTAIDAQYALSHSICPTCAAGGREAPMSPASHESALRS